MGGNYSHAIISYQVRDVVRLLLGEPEVFGSCMNWAMGRAAGEWLIEAGCYKGRKSSPDPSPW